MKCRFDIVPHDQKSLTFVHNAMENIYVENFKEKIV